VELGATGAGAVNGFGKVEVTRTSELCGLGGVEVDVTVEGADSVEGLDEVGIADEVGDADDVGGFDDVGEVLFELDVLGVDGVGPKSTIYDDRPHLKEEYVAVLIIKSHVTQAVLVPVQTPTAALQPLAAQEAASCA